MSWRGRHGISHPVTSAVAAQKQAAWSPGCAAWMSGCAAWMSGSAACPRCRLAAPMPCCPCHPLSPLSPLSPHCLVALLPCCLAALLPCCPAALLPCCCPAALLPCCSAAGCVVALLLQTASLPSCLAACTPGCFPAFSACLCLGILNLDYLPFSSGCVHVFQLEFLGRSQGKCVGRWGTGTWPGAKEKRSLQAGS